MLCVPVIGRDTQEVRQKTERANSIADMLEMRLDLMDHVDLGEILHAARKPVIVTYRSQGEGGRGADDCSVRADYLAKAFEMGPELVDVEYSLPPELRRRIFDSKGASRVIVSTHLINGTPSRESLWKLFNSMATTGADIVKIVTRARSEEDNLRVLELIPLARRTGVNIIAFCMGKAGRISRIASLLMGGYLTFVSLEKGEESADGQISIVEMKQILSILSP